MTSDAGPADGSPREPSGGPSRATIILIGAAVVIVALVAVLVIALTRGSGDDVQTTATGVDAAYVTAVTGPVTRLGDSAEATGRTLARASKPADVVKVAHMADQQLLLVQSSRRTIALVDVPASAHLASGTLARATQAHRNYLVTLSRLPDLETAKAVASLKAAKRQVATALTQYRRFGRADSTLVAPITTAGMADLGGLRTALAAKARQEAEAAGQSSGSGGTGSRGDGGETGSSSGGGQLSVSGAGGDDLGGTIRLFADYCDRSPGRVNDFIYSFEITRNGSVVASDSYSASQTRACNSIAMDFNDGLALGQYGVSVTVSNLTNNLQGTSYGTLVVTN